MLYWFLQYRTRSEHKIHSEYIDPLSVISLYVCLSVCAAFMKFEVILGDELRKSMYYQLLLSRKYWCFFEKSHSHSNSWSRKYMFACFQLKQSLAGWFQGGWQANLKNRLPIYVLYILFPLMKSEFLLLTVICLFFCTC